MKTIYNSFSCWTGQGSRSSREDEQSTKVTETTNEIWEQKKQEPLPNITSLTAYDREVFLIFSHPKTDKATLARLKTEEIVNHLPIFEGSLFNLSPKKIKHPVMRSKADTPTPFFLIKIDKPSITPKPVVILLMKKEEWRYHPIETSNETSPLGVLGKKGQAFKSLFEPNKHSLNITCKTYAQTIIRCLKSENALKSFLLDS